MQKRSELIFNLILLPVDFIAVMGAFVLAYAIRVKLEGRPVPNPLGIILFLKIFLLIVPVWILIFAVNGLYSQSVTRSRLNELGKVFASVSGGVMFMILIDFFSKQPIFPAKSIPIYGYGLSFVFVSAARQATRAIQRSLFRMGIGVHRTLIIGSGKLAQSMAAELRSPRSGYRLLGAVDTARNTAKRMKGLPVYATFDEAMGELKEIDEIIQADSALGPDEILEMVNYASNHHVVYRFVPNQFGLFATNSVMQAIAGVPTIEIRKTPLDGWGRIIKRTFDVLGASIGMVVLSPLFLVIAAIIKITDPGPVFYRHKRLSRVGREVYVYKFRSMYLKYSTGEKYSGKTDAEIFTEEFGRPELVKEFEKEQKLQNDPRVTPFGAFMRRTSLDELPQLINVLKGDLSLVGPRPIVEAELKHYGNETAKFLALKPGVTGLWQISGRSDISYEERVKLDIYYVESWSLLLDIKILLKTIVSVLRGRGAY